MEMQTCYKHEGTDTALFWVETAMPALKIVVGTVWFRPLVNSRGEPLDRGMAFSSVTDHDESSALRGRTLYRKNYPLPVTRSELEGAHRVLVDRVSSGPLPSDEW